jgi:hypothetical protein
LFGGRGLDYRKRSGPLNYLFRRDEGPGTIPHGSIADRPCLTIPAIAGSGTTETLPSAHRDHASPALRTRHHAARRGCSVLRGGTCRLAIGHFSNPLKTRHFSRRTAYSCPLGRLIINFIQGICQATFEIGFVLYWEGDWTGVHVVHPSS